MRSLRSMDLSSRFAASRGMWRIVRVGMDSSCKRIYPLFSSYHFTNESFLGSRRWRMLSDASITSSSTSTFILRSPRFACASFLAHIVSLSSFPACLASAQDTWNAVFPHGGE